MSDAWDEEIDDEPEDDAAEELERLRAENEQLRQTNRALTAQGAVDVWAPPPVPAVMQDPGYQAAREKVLATEQVGWEEQKTVFDELNAATRAVLNPEPAPPPPPTVTQYNEVMFAQSADEFWEKAKAAGFAS